MTEAELRERSSYWQRRLRLQDWDIHLAVKRARDMELEGRNAEISCHQAIRRAWIVIRDPQDYPETCAEPQDMEVSLVHELLHIYMRPFDLPREGPKHIAEEQMIEAVSRALVALDRKP